MHSHRSDRLLAAARGSRAKLGQELLRAHLGSPTASVDLPRAFREARALGSRDRRIAQDAIYMVARHQARYRRALAPRLGQGADLIELLYLSALVELGLDPAIATQLTSLPFPLEAAPHSDPLDQLAMEGSLPRWLLERSEDAQALVRGAQGRAPTTIRTNRARISRDKLKARLASEDILTEPGRFAPDALHIQGRANLQGSRAFRDGLFEIQDEGSQLLALLVQPTGRVLDWCAGAGGKSLALAALHDGPLLALDVRARALQEAEKRAHRAGFRLQTQVHGQAAAPQADRVLVDAPCSGTGTLRRDPCLRWRLSPEGLDALVQTQAQVLDQAAAHTAPGGQLVYATCSVLPCENQEQVAAFLARHPDWRQLPAGPRLPASCSDMIQGPDLAPRPERHGTDGFFAAVLQAPG